MSIRLFSHQSYIYITLFIILTIILFFFFLNYPATTEIYTLSLHDALPISSIAASAVDASSTRIAAELRCRRSIRRLMRSEEHTSELQSRFDLVCRLLL